jgi:hypothetical protein
MDLRLELDDDLLRDVENAAHRRGLTPEQWARMALRIYLGLATADEQQRLGQRIRRIEPLT